MRLYCFVLQSVIIVFRYKNIPIPNLRKVREEPALSIAEGIVHPLFCCASQIKNVGHPPGQGETRIFHGNLICGAGTQLISKVLSEQASRISSQAIPNT